MRKVFLGKCVCGYRTEELNTRSEVRHRLKKHVCTQGPLELRENTYTFCRHCGVGIVPQMTDLGTILRWLNAIESKEERTCFHRPGDQKLVFEMVKKECSSPEEFHG